MKRKRQTTSVSDRAASIAVSAADDVLFAALVMHAEGTTMDASGCRTRALELGLVTEAPALEEILVDPMTAITSTTVDDVDTIAGVFAWTSSRHAALAIFSLARWAHVRPEIDEACAKTLRLAAWRGHLQEVCPTTVSFRAAKTICQCIFRELIALWHGQTGNVSESSEGMDALRRLFACFWVHTGLPISPTGLLAVMGGGGCHLWAPLCDDCSIAKASKRYELIKSLQSYLATTMSVQQKLCEVFVMFLFTTADAPSETGATRSWSEYPYPVNMLNNEDECPSRVCYVSFLYKTVLPRLVREGLTAEDVRILCMSACSLGDESEPAWMRLVATVFDNNRASALWSLLTFIQCCLEDAPARTGPDGPDGPEGRVITTALGLVIHEAVETATTRDHIHESTVNAVATLVQLLTQRDAVIVAEHFLGLAECWRRCRGSRNVDLGASMETMLLSWLATNPFLYITREIHTDYGRQVRGMSPLLCAKSIGRVLHLGAHELLSLPWSRDSKHVRAATKRCTEFSAQVVVEGGVIKPHRQYR